MNQAFFFSYYWVLLLDMPFGWSERWLFFATVDNSTWTLASLAGILREQSMSAFTVRPTQLPLSMPSYLSFSLLPGLSALGLVRQARSRKSLELTRFAWILPCWNARTKVFWKQFVVNTATQWTVDCHLKKSSARKLCDSWFLWLLVPGYNTLFCPIEMITSWTHRYNSHKPGYQKSKLEIGTKMNSKC
jgi:hypothetical protein